MTHIHEWSLTGVNVGAYCPQCDTELYPDDIIKRLNDIDLLELEYDKLIKFIDEDVFGCDLDGIFRSFSDETMRRLHNKEPEIYCEHKQIMLHKLGRFDGSNDEWWQCDRCEQKFSPEGI